MVFYIFQDGFATKDKNCKMTDDDMQKIDISVFDENDLEQFQEKMLIIFSCCVGFRGSTEHAGLLTSQIGSGTFPSDHPTYPNQEWCGLLHFGDEKTHKLSFATSHTRETPEGLGRFPVLSQHVSDDPLIRKKDAGGAIKRYLALLPPTEHGHSRFYRRINKNLTAYLVNQVLGKNKIRCRFQSGFKRMGLKNWEKTRPHAARGFFITELANNPTVPIGWGCKASRHIDPATFMGYTTNGPAGGANVLNAVLNAVGGENSTMIGGEKNDDGGSAVVAARMTVEAKKQPAAKKNEDDKSSDGSQTTVVLSDHFCTNEKPSSINIPSTIHTPKKFQNVTENDFESQSQTSFLSSSVALSNRRGVKDVPSPAANQNYSIFTQVQLQGLEDDMARFEAGIPAPANHHQVKKNCATPATNQDYSFHTQYQMDELNSDVARLVATKKENIVTPSSYAPSDYACFPQRQRPRFEEASLDSLRGFNGRAYCQERRIPSKRELRLMRFRAQLNELERRERLRNLEEVEYDNMKRNESFPYWSSFDEYSTLYHDSVKNQMENEEMARRMRKNPSKKRPFY